MIAIVDGPIPTATVREAVSDPGHGAILVFEGVARDHFEGRAVLHLEYEAYTDMALPEMSRIADECAERFGARIAMVHRTGTVAIGEPSVVIAVGAAHRDEAYAASRYAIDQLKLRVPIWKKECYADGSAWKANPKP